MGNIGVKVKKIKDGAAMPLKATSGAAAADLYALCPKDGITIKSGERAVIPTGIAIELPDSSCVALIFARSGLGIKKGITLSNGVGVIDSDYRGEICVGLINLSDESYTVKTGERIAQMAIMPVFCADFFEVKELSQTMRGEGGLGSTGLK